VAATPLEIDEKIFYSIEAENSTHTINDCAVAATPLEIDDKLSCTVETVINFPVSARVDTYNKEGIADAGKLGYEGIDKTIRTSPSFEPIDTNLEQFTVTGNLLEDSYEKDRDLRRKLSPATPDAVYPEPKFEIDHSYERARDARRELSPMKRQLDAIQGHPNISSIRGKTGKMLSPVTDEKKRKTHKHKHGRKIEKTSKKVVPAYTSPTTERYLRAICLGMEATSLKRLAVGASTEMKEQRFDDETASAIWGIEAKIRDSIAPDIAKNAEQKSSGL
jgi:hypothetical protein